MMFSVTSVTTFVEVIGLLVEPTIRGVKLEGPEESIGLLEMRANGVDFMDKILHTDDPVLPEGILDDLIVGDRDALLVKRSETSLVNQFTNRLQVGVTESNIVLHTKKHLLGGSVQSNEDTVVDLTKAQKTQDLLHLGVNSVNTTDSHNESKLRLGFHEKVVGLLSRTSQTNQRTFLSAVLLGVFFSTLEDHFTASTRALERSLGVGSTIG